MHEMRKRRMDFRLFRVFFDLFRAFRGRTPAFPRQIHPIYRNVNRT